MAATCMMNWQTICWACTSFLISRTVSSSHLCLVYCVTSYTRFCQCLALQTLIFLIPSQFLGSHLCVQLSAWRWLSQDWSRLSQPPHTALLNVPCSIDTIQVCVLKMRWIMCTLCPEKAEVLNFSVALILSSNLVKNSRTASNQPTFHLIFQTLNS